MLWATSSSPPIHDPFMAGSETLSSHGTSWKPANFAADPMDSTPLPSPNLTFRPSYKVRAVEAHCCWCPSSCFSCSIFLWQRNPRNGHWNWENHRTIAVRFSGHGKKNEGSWPKFDDLKDGSLFQIAMRNEAARTFLPWQLLWIACSIPPLFCIHKPLTLSLNTPRPQNFATPDLQLD